MDSFVSVDFLFEVINFKNVWDTTDNTRRCKNRHLKWKISQPSAAALGFPSFVLYRLMMVRGRNAWTFLYKFTVFTHLPFCTDLVCFPSYLSVQIYCALPASFLYRFIVPSHLPFCTHLLCFPSYLSVVCHSSKYVPYLFLSLQEFLLCLIKESLFSVNIILLHLYYIGWPRTRGTTAADGAAATPATTST